VRSRRLLRPRSLLTTIASVMLAWAVAWVALADGRPIRFIESTAVVERGTELVVVAVAPYSIDGEVQVGRNGMFRCRDAHVESSTVTRRSRGAWLRADVPCDSTTKIGGAGAVLCTGGSVGLSCWSEEWSGVAPDVARLAGGVSKLSVQRDGSYVGCAVSNGGRLVCLSQTPQRRTAIRRFPGRYSDVATGDTGGLVAAVAANGYVFSNGVESCGESRASGPSWRRVAGIRNAMSVSAGMRLVCITDRDGDVWCWGGHEGWRDYEQVVAAVCQSAPARVPLPGPARGVAVHKRNVCAALVDGRVACWADAIPLAPPVLTVLPDGPPRLPIR